MNQNNGSKGQNAAAEDKWLEPAGSSEDIRRLRPLTVLEHLTTSSKPLTRTELAHAMGVPKSTMLRLLRSMESRGYVLQTPLGRGFVPGPRAINLSLRTLRVPNVRRECQMVLRNLVAQLGETCNLTVPDAGRVLYVERVETDEPLRMHLLPGTWVPMHCTASGKLFLASLTRSERQRVLQHLPLDRFSPHTIVDADRLAEELHRITTTRIGIDNEEFVRGMVAVAVPVCGPDNSNHVVAAIACHAPTARVSLDHLINSIPDLRVAAEAIVPTLFPQAG